MKILFSGASSFTGFWFISELVRQGHVVFALFRRNANEYADDVRRYRVNRLREICRAEHGVSFGDPRFISLLQRESPWDLYCHHAAEVGDYRSAEFDVLGALASNTNNIKSTLAVLREEGCHRIVLTGSVFEDGEGAGSGRLSAVSPYGLSKSLTADVFRYFADASQLRLGKFVIPNPFGPYEERRFTAYLMTQWLAREKAVVKSPGYVRDNVHVSLLTKAYSAFCSDLPPTPGFSRFNPSGYVETQGAFAGRFATEMRVRLELPCEMELMRQMSYSEPKVRINFDSLDAAALDWNEEQAWDDIAEYYKKTFRS